MFYISRIAKWFTFWFGKVLYNTSMTLYQVLTSKCLFQLHWNRLFSSSAKQQGNLVGKRKNNQIDVFIVDSEATYVTSVVWITVYFWRQFTLSRKSTHVVLSFGLEQRDMTLLSTSFLMVHPTRLINVTVTMPKSLKDRMRCKDMITKSFSTRICQPCY